MNDDALYEAVRRYAARLLSDAQIAQDIAQEVFLRQSTQTPPPENPRAWAYRTARNLVIDHFRKTKRLTFAKPAEGELESLPDAATRFNPVLLAEQKELNAMLHEKIDELSPRHREVLRLKFQEGLKYAEIAEVIGEPITTVGWLLHEAIQKLRDSLTRSTG